MKQLPPSKKRLNQKNPLLVALLCAAGLFYPDVMQASDIQIYQNPRAQNFPIIMLAIDNSGSMSIQDAQYQGKTVTRMEALKQALVDTLTARDNSGQYRIPEQVYVGISVFTGTEVGTTPDWLTSGEPGRASKILIPAKPLTAQHRAELIRQIQLMKAQGSTPTPLLLSETYAYLLGTKTWGNNLIALDQDPSSRYSNYTRGLSGASLSALGTVDAHGRYIAPLTQLSPSDAQCSTQGVFFLTDGAPVGIRPKTILAVMQNVVEDASFQCDASPIKDVYYNFSTANDLGRTATYTGEFREMASFPYPITLNEQGNSGAQYQTGWQNRSSWACVGWLAKRLSNQIQHTHESRQKRIYTATVGFGPLFEKHQDEHCVDLDGDGWYDHCYFGEGYTGSGVLLSNTLNAQALKQLGQIVGKGDTYGTAHEIGGYHQATSGEHIQQAFNQFLFSVSHGNFAAANFGSFVAPVDQFSPGQASRYIFSSQFQPKIGTGQAALGSTHRLWLGNMKKYQVNANAQVLDRFDRPVLDTYGVIRSNTRDLWNATAQDDGKSAILGGLFSQIQIPNPLSDAASVNGILTRPLFIDASLRSTGWLSKGLSASNPGTLTRVTSSMVLELNDLDIEQSGWRQNRYQPYLLSALGYQLDPAYLSQLSAGYVWDRLDKLKPLPVMRQMGAVMHSEPLLLTLQASYNPEQGITNPVNSPENRQDYLLFGTLQGLLHLIDPTTGEEVFSFLPYEILQDPERRDALLAQANTLQASMHPIYGMDGSWTADVQYDMDQTQQRFMASQAYVYGGMRMGGKSYYALDLKNPFQPKLLFHIDPQQGQIRSLTQFDQVDRDALQAMGYSWSKPTLANIRINGQLKKVMIVGGGYDMAYETEGYQPGEALSGNKANQGAGIYIFDAQTGALLWHARHGTQAQRQGLAQRIPEMQYSVVSQIKILDRNADGLVDHLYFGDLGGQLWRVDLNNQLASGSADFARVTRLTDFSAYHQRFYEMPAVTIHEHDGQRFAAISLASGNRSLPLSNDNGFDHRVYVLHDHDIAATNLFQSSYPLVKNLNEDDLYTWNSLDKTTLNHLVDRKKKGWYYILRRTTQQDESPNTGTVKAMNGYVAIANSPHHSDLYVSLYNPNDPSSQQPNQCSGGLKGSSRVMKLCLPFGICGDIQAISELMNNRFITISGSKSDGISRLNTVAIRQDNRKKITLLGGEHTQYVSTRVFRPYNWQELP